ncbi:nuclear pore complex-interacting protein family member B3-like, partial [Nomascus leucogenys]|uniref:nuclear pore complex-interacting protein family member B3-like n=1 Tax=Nomascus leucogenys TaxID=61853 RepID=UPI00122DC4B5
VSFLKTVLKSRNVHDRSTDVQRRAWRSNSRSQEGPRSTCMHTKKRVSSFPGIKISMEDLYTSWRYMEAKVPAEVHKVMMKVNSHYKINGQRKTAKEEKLFHAAERLRRQAEDYYRRKITPSARKPHANWFRMAAVEHHHSSGLPYWPYLTAETLRKRKGRQAPPPTQCHLGGQPPPSAKGCLRPLNLSRLQFRLGPQPHSTTDDFLRRDKLQVECPLGAEPFPPADDFPRLKTPPEGLFVPLPPSPLDDSLGLKTPPECLLVPLPPSPVDNFLTPEKPPVECRWGPVPSPRGDNVRKRKTPPDSFFVPVLPSPLDDSLSLKTPPSVFWYLFHLLQLMTL